MAIFLTETLTEKGLWCGEDIEADSWEEAREKCPDGYRVIGELVATINYE